VISVADWVVEPLYVAVIAWSPSGVFDGTTTLN